MTALLPRLLLAALVVAAATVAGPRRAGAIEIQEVVSDGGIKAWLVEEHSIPLIAIDMVFRGSAALDAEGREGVAYMVSGLLDEGAGEYDALAFQTRLDDRAIRLGFDAGRDFFSASMRTLTAHRDEAFRLLGLALAEPRLETEAVERIRSQILALLASRAENPGSIAGRQWYETVFGDHPYARAVEGTPQSVPGIETDDLRAFVRGRLARGNMTVAVVGDIDAGTLAVLLDRAFGGLPETAGDFRVAEIAPETAPGVRIIRMAVPQSVIIFGHRGIKRDDPDWYAALVMNYILGGGGFSSRLMEEVREKRGLAYSVSSSLRPYQNAGLFIGSAGTGNADVAQTITLIGEEIRRLHDYGVTAAELGDAKTYLTGSYPLNFGSSGQIASQLVRIQLNGLGIDYIDHRNSYIEAVTLDKIKQVAGRLLQPDRLFWVVVGDPEGPIDGALE